LISLISRNVKLIYEHVSRTPCFNETVKLATDQCLERLCERLETGDGNNYWMTKALPITALCVWPRWFPHAESICSSL